MLDNQYCYFIEAEFFFLKVLKLIEIVKRDLWIILKSTVKLINNNKNKLNSKIRFLPNEPLISVIASVMINVCILVIWGSACWVHKAHGPAHKVKAHIWACIFIPWPTSIPSSSGFCICVLLGWVCGWGYLNKVCMRFSLTVPHSEKKQGAAYRRIEKKDGCF